MNRYNSNNKKKPVSTKVVNNKNKINNFHQEILEHSARYIKVNINEFDNEKNTLTIKNMKTDYGTQGPSPNNFEIIAYGLNIPGNFKVEDTDDGVLITLFERYIDYEIIEISDIYVIGKLLEVIVTDESNNTLSTENDLDLIL